MIGLGRLRQRSTEMRKRAALTLRDAWRRWCAPVLEDPRVVASACQRAYFVWRAGGRSALVEWYQWKMRFRTPEVAAAEWWSDYQRGAWRRRLRRLRRPRQGVEFGVVLAPRSEQVTWWRAAIDSVRDQVYPHWELLIVVPTTTAPATVDWLRRLERGDARIRMIQVDDDTTIAQRFNTGLQASDSPYVAFLDEADVLEPEAIALWNEGARDGSGLLYSDEVESTHDLNNVGAVRALPAFSYDYFLASDYLPAVWAARRELLLAVHGFDESVDRYDLLLRLCERTDRVTHIPGIASRRRRYPERGQSAGLEAVAGHMARIGSSAAVHVRSGLPRDLIYPSGPRARVAAIIPTKDRADLLAVCLRTLEPLVAAGTLDLIVVDHESKEPETLDLLTQVASRHRVLPYRGAFNFSAMMNRAVATTAGQYTHYLLLNNDIEALDADWLEHMLGLACRQEVGIVGATLLYPDRRVQHAGVVTGLCGAAAHAHVLEPFADATGQPHRGYLDSLAASRDVNAVTGACLLVRADVLQQLGGFDERLRVGFGDVDLCLRARAAGYKVLIDAQAVLVHHESLTRGKRFWGAHPDDSLYFAARYFRGAAAQDPFYNPLLSPVTARYVLNRQARAMHWHAPRTQAVKLPTPAAWLWDRAESIREAA